MVLFFGIGPALGALIGAIVHWASARPGGDGQAITLRIRLLNGAFAGFISVVAVAVLYLGLIWKPLIGDAVGDGEAACAACLVTIVCPTSFLAGLVFGAGLGQRTKPR